MLGTYSGGTLTNLKGEGFQNLEDVGRRVILAIPYYGYARQDKRFSAGEVIAAGVIASHLSNSVTARLSQTFTSPEFSKVKNIP